MVSQNHVNELRDRLREAAELAFEGIHQTSVPQEQIIYGSIHAKMQRVETIFQQLAACIGNEQSEDILVAAMEVAYQREKEYTRLYMQSSRK